jgi:phage shock protein PspC (stress-responsive transcriptional regulator)
VTKRHLGYHRHPDALLAGVCADIAQRLGWNTWALRALAVLGLFIDLTVTGGIYLLLAILLPLLRSADDKSAADGLSAPELSDRNARITELERRFRELEEEDGR